MSRRTLLCGAAMAAVLMVAPAQADTTPAQAGALQVQLHDWLAGVIGPSIDLPPLPVQFVAEGDHFRMQMPIAGTIAGTGVTIVAAGPWAGTVRVLEGGRYAVDNLSLPLPMKISRTEGPVEMQGSIAVTAATQESHSILDPTLATTSSYDGRAAGLVATFQTSRGNGQVKIAKVTAHQTSQPKDGGRQNLVFETVMDGYDSVQPGTDGEPVHVSIARATQSGHADGFDFAQLGTMLRTSIALGQMASTEQKASPKAEHPMTPAQQKAARTIAAALADLLTLVDVDQTVERLEFEAGGISGKIAKLAVGMGFGAPKGEMELHMRVAVDGIESPAIPPGAFANLVPKHIAFSPRLSGIPKAEAMRLLMRSIEIGNGDQSAVQADAMAMLDKSPVTVGIEDLAIELGVAQLTGSGSLDVSSATDMSGEAELRMTGIDALVKQLGAAPETKMAVPVLIFLKGIGEQDDKEMVWTVKYEDSKVTVNGTDLSDMIPKGK